MTPLRVAHVLGPLRHSGAERMLLSAADLFEREGIKSGVISLDSPAVSPLDQAFRDEGFDVFYCGAPTRSSLVRNYIARIRAWEPDCVHVHAEHASVATTTMARMLRVPVVLRTVHNVFGFPPSLRLRKRLERAAARRAGVVHVAITDSVAHNELHAFRNPTTKIYNWFDETRFRPPSASERARARAAFRLDGSPVVSVVGNCSTVKNHSLLFEALAMIPPADRPVVLHAGAPEEPDLEAALVEEHGLQPWVRFLGPSDDVTEVLHAADAFAMPSLYEGLPIAAMEAAATGLPLILADSPGLRDLAMYDDSVRLHALEPRRLATLLSGVAAVDYGPRQRTAPDAFSKLFDRETNVLRYVALYRGEQPPTAG